LHHEMFFICSLETYEKFLLFRFEHIYKWSHLGWDFSL
jgi:hypothetical protein